MSGMHREWWKRIGRWQPTEVMLRNHKIELMLASGKKNEAEKLAEAHGNKLTP